MGLTVLGVRHHSPACARLVADSIDELRPRYVLVEGPSDMNARLDELTLSHRLPIAIFSYRTASEHRHASWTPLCDYSPEWVAVTQGKALGSETRFIDLPAWHKAFWNIQNRYGDRQTRASRLVEALCRRFAVTDVDALWDHLFEQPIAPDELALRLRAYFEELRHDDDVSPADRERETYMARCIAWAMNEARKGDEVLVVCGGYHAPYLEAAWKSVDDPSWPDLPDPGEDVRFGSYLVPYSFRRLDSFAGYESGMPSPAFQQIVWEEGVEQAATTVLLRAVTALRKKRQLVSPADVIAASAMAEGLKRLRGHDVVGRSDVLDGMASALVKEALDVPHPWTQRGLMPAGTHPALVAIMSELSGARIGRLHPDTPRPPLLHDVAAELEAHDLRPAHPPRDVALDLTQDGDRARSRVLHRLRVLDIPGFIRRRGPSWATEGPIEERWSLDGRLDAEPALIEAGAFGATLESAAAAKLEGRLQDTSGDLVTAVAVLVDAVFVGIHAVSEAALPLARRRVGAEASLSALGDALSKLLGLWDHDVLFGAHGSPFLGEILEAVFARGLWLVEGLRGKDTPADSGHLAAFIALRDTFRRGRGKLALDPEHAHAVMSRTSMDRDAPPAGRGAALGFLWATGGFADPDEGARRGVASVRSSARPDRPEALGDYLAGLFAVAREEMDARIVAAIDQALEEMTDDAFLVALTSLRLAFSFFPPSEKDRLARMVLEARGMDRGISLTSSLPGNADDIARAVAIERRVTELMTRYGLWSREP